MPMMLSNISHVRFRALVIVAALVCLPPLVRATQPLDPGSGPQPIRLNRGFAAPEAKAQVAPPSQIVIARAITRDAPQVPELTHPPRPVGDAIPDSPDASPDTLRGPPVRPLV